MQEVELRSPSFSSSSSPPRGSLRTRGPAAGGTRSAGLGPMRWDAAGTQQPPPSPLPQEKLTQLIQIGCLGAAAPPRQRAGPEPPGRPSRRGGRRLQHPSAGWFGGGGVKGGQRWCWAPQEAFQPRLGLGSPIRALVPLPGGWFGGRSRGQWVAAASVGARGGEGRGRGRSRGSAPSHWRPGFAPPGSEELWKPRKPDTIIDSLSLFSCHLYTTERKERDFKIAISQL